MMIFAALRLIIGGAMKSIGEFVSSNWRWLLPLLSALSLVWYIHHIQSQRDEAVTALETHLQQDRAAVIAQQQENERKEREAADQINGLLAEHATQIEQIRKDYDAKRKTDKVAADSTIGLWRDRVRLELERQAASGVSDNTSNSKGVAESRGNCDAAVAKYEVLETACKVTTLDYNALRKWGDSVCNIYECK